MSSFLNWTVPNPLSATSLVAERAFRGSDNMDSGEGVKSSPVMTGSPLTIATPLCGGRQGALSATKG